MTWLPTIQDPIPVVEALSARLAVGPLAGRDDALVHGMVGGQGHLVDEPGSTLVTLVAANTCRMDAYMRCTGWLSLSPLTCKHAVEKKYLLIMQKPF
jgi:hypothetical protein